MIAASTTCRMPVAYITHGGGPMPLLGHQPAVASFFRDYHLSLDSQPSAILVISAHWITDKTVSVTGGSSHPLLFDYGGFPPETYEYTYDAPGSPSLATQICDLLALQNIPCRKDQTRGYDHGVFVPLLLMYPEANIPIVAMSLLSSMDPRMHVQIGKALAPLRSQGVLILGSGSSFHNFDYIFARSSQKKEIGSENSATFDKFLTSTFTESTAPWKDRLDVLIDWTNIPSGTAAHPVGQEEHLLPLHVVLGAAVGEDESESACVCKRFGFEERGFTYSSFEFR